jgi:hypothetical protein
MELHNHYNIFEVTFAVTSQSQWHSRSPYNIFGVTFGVASQSQLHPRSHLWGRIAVTAGPSQSLQPFGVTFAVASRSQRHSCSPYNIFGVTFRVCAVDPVATTVSYGVESAFQGLSLPTTYLPPSLSTQHLFTTNIYSTSLHTQADSRLFSTLSRQSFFVDPS